MKVEKFLPVIFFIFCSCFLTRSKEPSRKIFISKNENQQIEYLLGPGLRYVILINNAFSFKMQYKDLIRNYPGVQKFVEWIDPLPAVPMYMFRISGRGPGILFIDKDNQISQCWDKWKNSIKLYFHDEGDEYYYKDGIFLVRQDKYLFISPDLGLLKEIIGRFYSEAKNEVKFSSFWNNSENKEISGLLLYNKQNQPSILENMKEYEYKEFSFFFSDGTKSKSDKAEILLNGKPFSDKLGIEDINWNDFLKRIPDKFDFHLFMGVKNYKLFTKFLEDIESVKNFKWSAKNTPFPDDLLSTLKPGFVITANGQDLFDKKNNFGLLTKFAIFAYADPAFIIAWQKYIRTARIAANVQSKGDVTVWSWIDVKKKQLSYILLYNKSSNALVFSNAGTFGLSLDELTSPSKPIENALLKQELSKENNTGIGLFINTNRLSQDKAWQKIISSLTGNKTDGLFFSLTGTNKEKIVVDTSNQMFKSSLQLYNLYQNGELRFYYERERD
ncbi:MAG: hypothetical protein JXA60_04125 [Candidatus Coatesbacteria bacterium]|nr:hypothetical protein [Candidatus Coatesbacteria bacterium]